MFIETKNIESLLQKMYNPDEEYLPPDLKEDIKNLIFIVQAGKEVIKAFRDRTLAEEYIFQHNRYSWDKASIVEVDLL